MKRKAARNLLVGGSLVMALGSTAALAGYVWNPPASCTFNVDGSGSCSGTLLTFRDSTTYSDYASFEQIGDGSYAFRVNFQGRRAECWKYAPAGSSAAHDWNAAISHRGRFSITWNASGTCGQLYLTNASYVNDAQ